MFDESVWLSPLSMIFKFLCILHKKKQVCVRKTGFSAQLALRREPGVSADYPGFFY
jgi:hypothetical protein